ncbi:MAG: LytR/AlgR family response regulator transcription factor [Niabella sp.]
MEKMNCLIIEDEPLAVEILQEYIAEVPFLEVAGTASDAFKAMAILQEKKIDVIFLDVNLPKLKGIDFAKTLHEPYQIIITTAHRDYAFDGFELNVVDFLLKPIALNRFLTAVGKLKLHPQQPQHIKTTHHAQTVKDSFFINVNKKRIKIFFDDILFVESKREYVNIVTANKAHLTKISLGEIEEQLNTNGFIRVHRSFIVSKSKINAYTATDIEIAGFEIPIGRNFKEQVLAAFNKKE